ncbi:hypothetical protein VTL71DRAFT_8846 [Oculimacula yallundae]|uniref:Endo-1,4-beta-xylanase n=1 Tax=Oculimacula yallundae TaxID=86028 RepID=A0ABR4BT10_9HELO
MVLLGSFLGALSLSARSLSSPAPKPYALQVRQGGGFIVQNWANDWGEVNFVNGPAGAWSATWDNPPGGDLVVGKGYRPGGDMLFNYTGTFQVSGNAYLALYGWTTNPLVEYYVIEAMGNHNPSDNASATRYGTLESDGGTYEIWQKPRYGDSILGVTSFQQYWSIRTKMHCGGTINTGNHFRAWQAVGLELGKQNYMVMGVEGQQGKGSANITVGVTPTTRVPETATSTRRTETRRTTTRRSTSSVQSTVFVTVTATATARPTTSTRGVESTVYVTITATATARPTTSSRRTPSNDSTVFVTVTKFVTRSSSVQSTITRTVWFTAG